MEPYVVFIITSSLFITFVVLIIVFSINNTSPKNKQQENTNQNCLQKEDIVTGEGLLRVAAEVLSAKNNICDKYENVLIKFQGIPHNTFTGIVVSHQSDALVTTKNFENQKHLKLWFGVNVVRDSSKLICLPLGIADSKWSHGNLATLIKVMRENNLKTKLCYLNLSVSTNPSKREHVQRFFSTLDWITQGSRSNYETYLRELSCHKYSISPEGNGPDCHRMWECFYLGVIPVVLASVHQRLCFEGLPTLVVEKWSSVNKQVLVESYKKPLDPKYYEKLKLSFWKQKFKNAI